MLIEIIINVFNNTGNFEYFCIRKPTASGWATNLLQFNNQHGFPPTRERRGGLVLVKNQKILYE